MSDPLMSNNQLTKFKKYMEEYFPRTQMPKLPSKVNGALFQNVVFIS